jgi:regulator of extracellular matrix RemA (YlzA/DUF370 family)
MFLDIGGGVLVPNERLIAVLDPVVMHYTPDARIIWAAWRTQGRVRDVTVDGAKALVLLDDGVYISSVAPLTLKRRTELPWGKPGPVGSA